MPHINPFPERLPDEKAVELAAKRTAKEKEKAGLFAEYVEEITPEMIQKGVKDHHDKFDAMQVVLEERASLFRIAAERYLTAEEVAVEEKRLEALPDCPAYRADHWRQVLKKLGREPKPNGELQ